MVLMDVYFIGTIVAFIVGLFLAVYFNRLEMQKPEEERDKQNYGLICILALLSWVAVVIIIWTYRSKWKELFKVVFQKKK